MTTAVVSVVPGDALRRRRRLFDALAQSLSLRIVPGLSSAAVGVIRFGPDPSAPATDLPTLTLPSRADEAVAGEVPVRFADSDAVDRTLRGRSLPHVDVARSSIMRDEIHEVLAAAAADPVWVATARGFAASFPLPELGTDESLWTLASAGRFMPLIPLVAFLRAVHPAPWELPPLRASFLFDDPNLHADSYGYVDYRKIAASARELDYHVAFAMVPLDTWFASRAAVRLFQHHSRALSLLIHGNDHIRRELGTTDPDGARRLVAQALRRIERFERRYGIAVARVVAPPHGACSREAAAAMAEFGVDALCISRPNPWRENGVEAPAIGWDPADSVAGGLTVIPRVHLRADRAQLVLRAFLGHPLVLYGHHQDLRAGLSALTEAAEFIGGLGNPTWLSPSEIAATSFAVRREGATLCVRPYARRIAIEIPAGVETVVVDHRDGADLSVVGGDYADGRIRNVRTAKLVVRFGAPARDPRTVPPPPRRLWPYARRTLVESRDRLAPKLGRG